MAEIELPDFLEDDGYGFIHIRGHRIGINHVLDRYLDGASTMMIVEELPTLSPYMIDKVIAFYEENQQKVGKYLEDHRKACEEMAEANPSRLTLEELKRRMIKRTMMREAP